MTMLDFNTITVIDETVKKQLSSFFRKKDSEFFKWQWQLEKTGDYSYRSTEYTVNLTNGKKLSIVFHKNTIYKNVPKSRLRDTKKTKYQVWVEISVVNDLTVHSNMEYMYKSATGESKENREKIEIQERKIKEFASRVLGIENIDWNY